MRNGDREPGDLEVYLEALQALTFVRAVQFKGAPKRKDDALIEVEDARGKRERFHLELLRTHLSSSLSELWGARARHDRATLPALRSPCQSRHGPATARRRHFLRRSLRQPIRRRRQPLCIDRGQACRANSNGKPCLARPSYQVLSSYLARPELLIGTVREVAAQSNVSTSPVLEVRHKLVEQGWVFKTKNDHRWSPHGLTEARDFWLRGYQSTLRPSLFVGRLASA